MQRDLPWELDSALRTLGRSSLGETLGRSAGTPANFGSHCRVTVEADGSRRLIGSSFQEGPLSGELIFMEYDEDMRLMHRTSAALPVCKYISCLPLRWYECRTLPVTLLLETVNCTQFYYRPKQCLWRNLSGCV